MKRLQPILLGIGALCLCTVDASATGNQGMQDEIRDSEAQTVGEIAAQDGLGVTGEKDFGSRSGNLGKTKFSSRTEDARPALEQRKISGTIDSVKEQNLAGKDGKNLVVHVRTNKKSPLVPVTLGQASKVDRSPFKKGKAISVEGTPQVLEGKTFILANQVVVAGKTIPLVKRTQEKTDRTQRAE